MKDVDHPKEEEKSNTKDQKYRKINFRFPLFQLNDACSTTAFSGVPFAFDPHNSNFNSFMKRHLTTMLG